MEEEGTGNHGQERLSGTACSSVSAPEISFLVEISVSCFVSVRGRFLLLECTTGASAWLVGREGVGGVSGGICGDSGSVWSCVSCL